MKQLENMLQWGGVKKDILFLVIGGISLLTSLLQFRPFGFDLAWIAIILCGIPIILEAVIGLVTAFDIRADVLVSLALIASVIIGEIFAAGEVAFIMQLGALLEDMTVARARAGIEKLVHLTPRTARKLNDTEETIIPAEQVRINDILRVLPGETIPADGIILSGQTSVNQAVMTGESLPVDKTAGDEVSSGTVNQFGSFDMRATKAGDDSSIQRMIRLVQSADADKAKIVGIADRWATWIVVIALAAAAPDMADFRRNHPRGHNSRRLLPLCTGSCHSHSHYGSHWQLSQTRLSCPGRRCAGTSGRGICRYLRQNGDADPRYPGGRFCNKQLPQPLR